MKKSTTFPSNSTSTTVSNWTKKIARPTNLFTRTKRHVSPASKSKRSRAKDDGLSKVVQELDEETEKCLDELETEMARAKSPALHGETNQAFLSDASATTSMTTATGNSGSPDVLGSLCHLMNYVVHLRRENRRLRKQVLCLHEMRQIERLQNELLLRNVDDDRDHATRSPAAGSGSQPPPACTPPPPPPVFFSSDSPTSSMKNDDTHSSNSRSNVCPTVDVENEKRSDPAAALVVEKDATSDSYEQRAASAPVTALTPSTEQGAAQKKNFLAPPPFCRYTKYEDGRRVNDRRRSQSPLQAGQSPSVSSRADSPSSVSVSPDMRTVSSTTSSMDNVGSGSNYALQDRLTQSLLAARGDATNGQNADRKSRLTPAASFLTTSIYVNGHHTSIKHGGEEAMADANLGDLFSNQHQVPQRTQTQTLHMQRHGVQSMQTSACDDSFSYSPRSVSSAGSSLSKSVPVPLLMEDSDQEHSVFTEVVLPEYRQQHPPTVLFSNSNYRNKHNDSPRVWRYSDLSCASGNSCTATYAYVPLSLPEPEVVVQTRSQGILNRLGLKKPTAKKKSEGKNAPKTTSMGDGLDTDRKGKAQSALVAPLVSKSMYTEKTLGISEAIGTVDPTDRWKLAKKAFLKKRRRKISESDSLASSHSGKSYLTIDLPDINYCRQNAYPTSGNGCSLNTTGDANGNSKALTNEHATKMRQWRQGRAQRSQKSKEDNEKGDHEKRAFSKKLIQKTHSNEGNDENRDDLVKRYFESDDGRQNTIVELESSDAQIKHGQCEKGADCFSASDTDISRRSTNSQAADRFEPGPKAMGPADHLRQQQSQNDRQQQRQHQQQQQKQQKQWSDRQLDRKPRSVTFIEQMSPVDTTISLTTSQQLTVSQDSVFTSLEADMHRFADGSGPKIRLDTAKDIEAASEVVQELLVLQERNTFLIRTLKDKTKEYELITERLGDLENEVKTLRERYRFDANLEQLYSAVWEPNFVPVGLVQELEHRIQELDQNVRAVKTEAYEAQQLALETHANDQAATMRYLNQIDSLQKANFHLLSKNLSEVSKEDYPEIRRQLELLPTYEALYGFTINLLRKLKLIRTKMLEKNFSVSKLDLELLQTQSSLLLAHAQIERQKMEIKRLQTNGYATVGDRSSKSIAQYVRRTHSYHGQDILSRTVNAELSFYLPFKLQGMQMAKRDHRNSNMSLYNNDEALELEFAKLFDTVNRLSGHYDEIELPLHSVEQPKCQIPPVGQEPLLKGSMHPATTASNSPKRKTFTPCEETQIRWRRDVTPKIPVSKSSLSPQARPPPPQQQRPVSCLVQTPSKLTEVKRIADEITAGHYFASANENVQCAKSPPSYVKKAPLPLKLGNVGQVKAIAAAFDGVDDVSSAPNTPLAKAAPHLLQQQHAQKTPPQPHAQKNKTASALSASAVTASRLGNQDTEEHKAKPGVHSKIPLRAGVVQHSQIPQWSSPVASRLKQPSVKAVQEESPYETLTFLCKETSITPSGSPQRYTRQSNIRTSQLSPSTTNSSSLGLMEKSVTSDMDTVSTASTGGSTWSVSKKNEARKRQFFYGANSQRMHDYSAVSPLPPSSPTPRTPPTPIPPTPTPPSHGNRFCDTSNSPSDGYAAVMASSGHNDGRQPPPSTSSIPVPSEKQTKKTSWFQRLRQRT